MSDVDLQAAERVAALAVCQGALACRHVEEHRVRPGTLEKDDKSPVTVADHASQAVVCATLAEHDPGVGVVGEEDAAALRDASGAQHLAAVVEAVHATYRASATTAQILDWIDLGGAEPTGVFWTLDPIDGTKGFLRGDQYAVALGLVDPALGVLVGALGCPRLAGPWGTGVLFVAARGGGAHMRPLFPGALAAGLPAQITLERASELPRSAVRFCESVDGGHSDHELSARIARRLGIENKPARLDSQVKYGVLARGDAAVYLRLPTRPGYREKIWDHAAGVLVVEEAGGHVTDITGQALDFAQGEALDRNRGVIATRGISHAAVVEAVLAEMEPEA